MSAASKKRSPSLPCDPSTRWDYVYYRMHCTHSSLAMLKIFCKRSDEDVCLEKRYLYGWLAGSHEITAPPRFPSPPSRRLPSQLPPSQLPPSQLPPSLPPPLQPLPSV